jgi:hypothetical protein
LFFCKKTGYSVAAAEIEAVRYFSLDENTKETCIAPGAVIVLKQLQKEGYTD